MNLENTRALQAKHANILGSVDMSVSDHWYDIIDQLCTRITFLLHAESEPNTAVEAIQVKSKFGGLRFYIHYRYEVSDFLRDLIRDTISVAENKAWATCEECGDRLLCPKTTSCNGWLCTLCETCAEEAK